MSRTQAGFLRITATAAQLTFEYFRVPFGGVAETMAFDTFTAWVLRGRRELCDGLGHQGFGFGLDLG